MAEANIPISTTTTSVSSAKNPKTGLHEIKNPPTRPFPEFQKRSHREPNQVIPYAHSSKFRLYLLSLQYMPVSDLMLTIPACSKTFYRVSWSVEYLKNATRNALAQFLPLNTFAQVKDYLHLRAADFLHHLSKETKLVEKGTTPSGQQDQMLIAENDTTVLRKICLYFTQVRQCAKCLEAIHPLVPLRKDHFLCHSCFGREPLLTQSQAKSKFKVTRDDLDYAKLYPIFEERCQDGVAAGSL